MTYLEHCRSQRLAPDSPRGATSYAQEYLGNVEWPSADDVNRARLIGAHQAAHAIAADLRRSGLEVEPRWVKAYAKALEEAL